jgi:hypothetical protein
MHRLKTHISIMYAQNSTTKTIYHNIKTSLSEQACRKCIVFLWTCQSMTESCLLWVHLVSLYSLNIVFWCPSDLVGATQSYKEEILGSILGKCSLSKICCFAHFLYCFSVNMLKHDWTMFIVCTFGILIQPKYCFLLSKWLSGSYTVLQGGDPGLDPGEMLIVKDLLFCTFFFENTLEHAKTQLQHCTL